MSCVSCHPAQCIHSRYRTANVFSLKHSPYRYRYNLRLNEMKNNVHNGLPETIKCRAYSPIFPSNSIRAKDEALPIHSNSSIHSNASYVINIIIESDMYTMCMPCIEPSKCIRHVHFVTIDKWLHRAVCCKMLHLSCFG